MGKSGLIRYFFIIFVFVILNIFLINSLNGKVEDDIELKSKIVLISHVYTNPYWQKVKLGAEVAAEENNVIVDFEGPNYASAEEGVKLINMAKAANVSGIITYIQDDNSYNSVINGVIDSGIPLVTIDSDAEKSKRLAYIGTDNVEAGEMGAKEVIKAIGQDGKVAIIAGGTGVKNQDERINGFKSYLEENSNIEIIAVKSSDSYLLEAELAAKNILSQYEDIDALFCSSAQDGIGAAKAVKSMGLKDKVKIISFDDLDETLEDIEEGYIYSTIAQDPYSMGYNAVNLVVDIIKGKEVNQINLTNVYVINSENVEAAIEGVQEIEDR